MKERNTFIEAQEELSEAWDALVAQVKPTLVRHWPLWLALFFAIDIAVRLASGERP
jgi:hypothetical protein